MAPQNLADHGSFPQVRKPLRVIVLIVLYPFVIAGLIWFVLESFPGAPFEDAALVIVTVFGNVLMTGLLIYHRHKTRDRWIRAGKPPIKIALLLFPSEARNQLMRVLIPEQLDTGGA